jgi:hypothetical protein
VPRDLYFDAKHRQFTTLSPQLKQVFFIGRGPTAARETRRFVVPEGATRLYLGIMDAFEWNNNTGAFQVSVALGQTNVESAIFSVDSSVSFANWSCLPERTRCTPAKEIVEERSPGQFHVLLPAQMEWGVSIPTPPGSKVAVRAIKGTVCLTSDAETCSGSEGKDPAGEGFLVPHETVGSLVSKPPAVAHTSQ